MELHAHGPGFHSCVKCSEGHQLEMKITNRSPFAASATKLQHGADTVGSHVGMLGIDLEQISALPSKAEKPAPNIFSGAIPSAFQINQLNSQLQTHFSPFQSILGPSDPAPVQCLPVSRPGSEPEKFGAPLLVCKFDAADMPFSVIKDR